MDWFSEKIHQYVPPETLNWLESVSSSVNDKLQQTTTELSKKYTYYTSRPASVKCDRCHLEITVSDESWKWSCSACTFANQPEDALCMQCQTEKPSGFQPSVTCACGEKVLLPSTNAYKELSELSSDIAVKGNQALEGVVQKFNELNSQPTTFNCNFCGSIVTLSPTWSCPSCSFLNTNPNQGPMQNLCMVCSTPKDPIICTTCNNHPEVPSTVWKGHLQQTLKATDKLAMASYYKLTNQPFHTCSKCQTPLLIPPPPSNPPPYGQIATPNTIQLVCTNCHSTETAIPPPPPPPTTPVTEPAPTLVVSANTTPSNDTSSPTTETSLVFTDHSNTQSPQ